MAAVMLKDDMVKEIVSKGAADQVQLFAPASGGSGHLVLNVTDGVIIGNEEERHLDAGMWELSIVEGSLSYSRLQESDFDPAQYSQVEPQHINDTLEGFAEGRPDDSLDGAMDDALPEAPAIHPESLDEADIPTSSFAGDDPGYDPRMADAGRKRAEQMRQQGLVDDPNAEANKQEQGRQQGREPQSAGGISLGLGQLASGAANKIGSAVKSMTTRPEKAPDPYGEIQSKVREAAKQMRDYRASLTQLVEHYDHFQKASGSSPNGDGLISADTVNSAENYPNIAAMRKDASSKSAKAMAACAALMASTKDFDIQALIDRYPEAHEDIREIANGAEAVNTTITERFGDGDDISPLVEPLRRDSDTMRQRLEALVKRVTDMISEMLGKLAPRV